MSINFDFGLSTVNANIFPTQGMTSEFLANPLEDGQLGYDIEQQRLIVGQDYYAKLGEQANSPAIQFTGQILPPFTIQILPALIKFQQELQKFTYYRNGLNFSHTGSNSTLLTLEVLNVDFITQFVLYCDSLTALNLRDVRYMETFESNVSQVLLPNLEILANGLLIESGSIESLQLPSIVGVGTPVTLNNSSNIVIGDAVNFTNFYLGDTLKYVYGAFQMPYQLNQASVDNILVRLADLDGTNGTLSYNNRTINLMGENAPPSQAGLDAKAILQARGCTVTHN